MLFFGREAERRNQNEPKSHLRKKRRRERGSALQSGSGGSEQPCDGESQSCWINPSAKQTNTISQMCPSSTSSCVNGFFFSSPLCHISRIRSLWVRCASELQSGDNGTGGFGSRDIYALQWATCTKSYSYWRKTAARITLILWVSGGSRCVATQTKSIRHASHWGPFEGPGFEKRGIPFTLTSVIS